MLSCNLNADQCLGRIKCSLVHIFWLSFKWKAVIHFLSASSKSILWCKSMCLKELLLFFPQEECCSFLYTVCYFCSASSFVFFFFFICLFVFVLMEIAYWGKIFRLIPPIFFLGERVVWTDDKSLNCNYWCHTIISNVFWSFFPFSFLDYKFSRSEHWFTSGCYSIVHDNQRQKDPQVQLYNL